MEANVELNTIKCRGKCKTIVLTLEVGRVDF